MSDVNTEMLATAARFAFAARRTPYFVDIAALPRRCKHDSNDRLPDDADRTIGARKADREERASNLLSPENLECVAQELCGRREHL